MARSKARRRPLPRWRDQHTNRRVFQGPVVQDAVSGFHIPLEEAVRQRGGYVDRRWSAGTRDRPDDY